MHNKIYILKSLKRSNFKQKEEVSIGLVAGQMMNWWGWWYHTRRRGAYGVLPPPGLSPLWRPPLPSTKLGLTLLSAAWFGRHQPRSLCPHDTWYVLDRLPLVHESDHQPGIEDALTDGVRVSMSQQHMVPLSCYPLASDLIGLRVRRTPAYARISTESEDRRCTQYEAYPAGRNVASRKL